MLDSTTETGTSRSVNDMSVREFFTGIALYGLSSSMGGSDARTRTNIWNAEHVADKAVQLADEVMLRLARPPR